MSDEGESARLVSLNVGEPVPIAHGSKEIISGIFKRSSPFMHSISMNGVQNFTPSDWTEDDICIGDIIEASDVVFQVSQPRQPCFKLGIRHQMPELTELVRNQGNTGFYFRVLQEGTI